MSTGYKRVAVSTGQARLPPGVVRQIAERRATRVTRWALIGGDGIVARGVIEPRHDVCRCGAFDADNGSVVCWVCGEIVITWTGSLTDATWPG